MRGEAHPTRLPFTENKGNRHGGRSYCMVDTPPVAPAYRKQYTAENAEGAEIFVFSAFSAHSAVNLISASPSRFSHQFQALKGPFHAKIGLAE